MKTLRWLLLLLLTVTVVAGLSPTASAIPPLPTASTLEGQTWEAPGTIGSTTPSTGAFTSLTDTGVSGILKCAGAVACSQASSGSDYLLPGISDYQYIPVDAGMDSIIAAPDAAIRVQGIVGSTIPVTPASISYTTFTVSGSNITNAVWGSGTQTAKITTDPITVGKLYRLQFTPLVTGQVPTFAASSGMDIYSIPTIASGSVENIYFRATATPAVFSITNTAASTWSTSSTSLYEYSRPAIVREFSNSAIQVLGFDWKPPADWDAGTITVIPYGVITETAPADTNTAIWSVSGFCVASSGSLSQALGTAQTSTMTFDATYALYDEWIGSATAAITLPGAAAGTKCHIMVDRTTAGTYAQKIGLGGIMVKFKRVLAP